MREHYGKCFKCLLKPDATGRARRYWCQRLSQVARTKAVNACNEGLIQFDIRSVTRQLRQHIASSPLASLAALPSRIATVGRYNASTLTQSVRWLVRSREHTNFTYDLEPLNREHLAWFIASVTDRPVDDVRGFMLELEHDGELRELVRDTTEMSARRGLADPVARWHKRLGWYAIIRAVQPRHVVETGTDKGLGSLVLASALIRNGSGRLTTIDINSSAGYLIRGRYADVVDVRVGDSLPILAAVNEVDVFLHDSLHTFDHETREYRAVAPRLADGGLVLSDNAHATPALPQWAEQTGRRFAYWQERPADHWYSGGGIGVAWSIGKWR